MTITSQVIRNIGLGNGVTKAWPFTFIALAESHIHVYLISPAGVETELATGFAVSPTDLLFPTVGGTVTYPVSGNALATGWQIVLEREVPITQEVAYPNNATLNPKVIEGSLDKLTMITQQIANDVQVLESYNIALAIATCTQKSAEASASASSASASAATAAISANEAANFPHVSMGMILALGGMNR